MGETCSKCGNPIKGGEEFRPTAHPWHLVCERREKEGRCLRCGQYATICGHALPAKERWKRVGIDKSSMRP